MPPDAYNRIFEATAEVTEYDPVNNLNLFRNTIECTKIWFEVQRHYLVALGCDGNEFCSMVQTADDEVLSMRKELDKLNPEDFIYK